MGRPALVLGLLTALMYLGSPPAVAGLGSVWAVDDGEKIYQDDTTNPLKSGGGDNAVWNGSTISLSSARNEIVAFQLILEADGSGASDVDVHVSNLTNGASSIRGSHPLPAPNDYVGVGVELFTEHYLDIFDPSGSPTAGYFNWSAAACPNLTGLIPDALVPFSAAVGKGGAPFDIAPNLNQGVWVDIYVDKDLPAGLYTGDLVVSVGGVTHTTLPIQLQVLDLDLPDENHYKTMIFYSGENIQRKHGLGCCTSEQFQTLYDYNRMAHRHRLDLIGGGSTFDTTRVGDVLNGDAYLPAVGYEGPGEGVGNSVFSIATYGGWWWQNQAYYETESDYWVNWFAANAPGVEYFLYLIDEPSPSLYPEIATRASWIHNNPGPGHALPVFVTKHPTDALVGSVDIWSDPTASYDTATTATARARGEDVWPYAAYRPKTPADVIDDYGIAYRLKAWIAHKVGISRWFTWESTHWSGNSNELDPGGAKNVWAYPFTFECAEEENNGNGDGTLFYPGRDFDFPEEDRQYPGPIASYRMKMYRRGAQDVEYMWLAEQAGKGSDVQKILQDLLPHVMDDALTTPDWSNADCPYDQARRELADLILGTARVPSVRFAASPTRGPGPLPVIFTDLSTFSPTSWAWDFGDGGTSTAQNPAHDYTGLGSYTVGLTATNAHGSNSAVKTDCVTVTNEIIVYPDTWETQGGWADATLVSGGLPDVHYDDDTYMVTSCEPSSQRHSVLYYGHAGYTPDQVARITIEYQGKSSRSDNPGGMLVFVRPSDGNWSNGYMGNWTPTNTDAWYTFDTTNVAGIMSLDGTLGFELCGCPSTANNYQISTDVMRFRLELSPGAPVAPVAAFSGSPTSGPAPLTVHFTDASSNSPTSWAWDFGDGGASTEQSPSHTYTNGGSYTVSLIAGNAGGSDAEAKASYITVTAVPAPVADFTATPTTGVAPLPVTFTDASTGSPTSWAWDFGDGGASTAQSPSYTYTDGGSYTVALTVTNAGGSDAESKSACLRVASFPDVLPADWGWTEVEACHDVGIVGGYPDGTYRPGVDVTRDQMAVYIQRALSLPVESYQGLFPDIAAEDFGALQIEALVGANVVGGYPDGLYHPEIVVTRDQMAVFIARGMLGGDSGLPTAPASATFPDVPITGYEADGTYSGTGTHPHWAFRHIEYLVSQAVVGGYPDGQYWPLINVTRGQMAVFVYRAFLSAPGVPAPNPEALKPRPAY